jgi:hypothetical protein
LATELCAIGETELLSGVDTEVMELSCRAEHRFAFVHRPGLSRHAVSYSDLVDEQVNAAEGVVHRKQLREPVLVRAPLEAPLISIPLDNTTHDGITSVD